MGGGQGGELNCLTRVGFYFESDIEVIWFIFGCYTTYVRDTVGCCGCVAVLVDGPCKLWG